MLRVILFAVLVCLWTVSAVSKEASLAYPNRPADEPQMSGLSADGKQVILGLTDGTIVVRSIDAGTELARTKTEIAIWAAMALSHDNRRAVALGRTIDQRIVAVLWDTKEGRLRQIVAPWSKSEKDFFQTPVFSRDGQSIILSEQRFGEGNLVDFASGRILARLGQTAEHAFSPDSNLVVSKSADKKGVTVFDAKAGKRIGSLQLAGLFFDVLFRPDGRLLVIDYDCKITPIVGLPEGLKLENSLLASNPFCDPDRVSEDGKFLTIITSRSVGSKNFQVVDLNSGQVIASQPTLNISQNGTVAGDHVLMDREKLLSVSPLKGGKQVILPVPTFVLSNSYRSRILAGERLLTDFPDEPVTVFDIATRSQLLCIDRLLDCASHAARTKYQTAQAVGVPADIVASLATRVGLKAELGPLWGDSRIALAKAQVALGNPTLARAAFEEAILESNVTTRARGALGLTAILLEAMELDRASVLLNSTISDVEKAGALSEATTLTLVRRSNGLRVELSAVDFPRLTVFVDEMRAKTAKDAAGNAPLWLDENDYTRLSDISEIGTVPIDNRISVGGSSAPSAYTYVRNRLFFLLGEAEVLRANLLLSQREDADTARAAIAALDRFSTSFDGDRSPLPTALRAARQSLRAQAMERLDKLSDALGPRSAALSILQKDENAPPLALVDAYQGLATTQQKLASLPQALQNLEAARNLLVTAVPQDSVQLLNIHGQIGLLLVRERKTLKAGVAEIADATQLARNQIGQGAPAQATQNAVRLRALFAAGVEANWLESESELPTENLAAAPIGSGLQTSAQPLQIGFDSTGAAVSLQFSADGSKLLSRQFNRAIRWDVETGMGEAAFKLDENERPKRFDSNAPIDFADGDRLGMLGAGTFTVEKGGNKLLQIDFGDVISVAAVSPDSKLIALGGGRSPIVRVYDAQTGAMVKQLDGHLSPIRSLVWHPDSERLASGGADGKILVFNIPVDAAVAMGTNKGLDTHTGEVNALAFSPDSTALYSVAKSSGSEVKRGRKWDVATRRVTDQYETDGGNWVVVAPDQSKMAVVGAYQVDIFGPSSPDISQKIDNFSNKGALFIASSTAIVGDNDVLVVSNSGGTKSVALSDGKLRWWNAEVSGSHLSVSADGKHAAVAQFFGDSGSMVLINAKTGKVKCTFNSVDDAKLGQLIVFSHFAFSTNGATLSAVGEAMSADSLGLDSPKKDIQRTATWDANSCKLLSSKTGEDAERDVETQSLVMGGAVVAMSRRMDKSDDPIVKISFTSDQRRAIAVSRKGTVWLADGRGSAPAQVLAKFASKIGAISVSPDGHLLAVASDSNIWLWDVLTGKFLGRMGE